jgi:uncharacterized protein (TIGR02246 family)
MEKFMEQKQNFLEIAQANFQRWNEALQTKDAKQVAEMYTADNLFLPTMSPDFKRGTTGAEEYFTHFLEKNPVGKITEDGVISVSPDAYLHTGMYDFEIDNKETGGRQIAKARFSYLWQKDEKGNWKIAHHHSSVLPA